MRARIVPSVLTVLSMLLAGARVNAADAHACDSALNDRRVVTHATAARELLIAASDADDVTAAWQQVFDAEGSVAWPATVYNADARSTFVLAFGRDSLRVYRENECVNDYPRAEAVVLWRDVREIRAGNWVLWIKFERPITLMSDRGKGESVRELQVNLHGGNGDLTFLYNFNRDTFEFENVRGVAVGPTNYQRRIQFIVARMVDPEGRIKLTRKGRGAGW